MLTSEDLRSTFRYIASRRRIGPGVRCEVSCSPTASGESVAVAHPQQLLPQMGPAWTLALPTLPGGRGSWAAQARQKREGAGGQKVGSRGKAQEQEQEQKQEPALS